MCSKITDSGQVEHLSKRAIQTSEQRLGLRVAEAGIEFDDTDAMRGQCQARVQQSAERCAAPRHLIDGRLQHRLGDFLGKIIRRPRQWGVRAHAASVRPGVSVPDTFEVLRRLHGAYGAPVGDPKQTYLRPVEELLDHYPTALQSMINSKLSITSDDDAFASCKPVILDNIGRSELAKRLINLVTRRAFSGTCCGHPSRSHYLLGEGLAAFQLRCGRRGSEAGDATLAYGIRDTRDQRRLRSYNDQVDAESPSQAGYRSPVERVDWMIRAQLCGAGIARRSVQCDDRWVAAERQAECVLPSAGADHQHAQCIHHVPKAYPSVEV